MAKPASKVLTLFAAAIAEGEEIKNTCKRLYFIGNKKTISPETFEAWKMNCLSLLKSTFGSSSPHYDSFTGIKFFDFYNSTQIYLGIMKGAKKDLEKGYFFHKDLMLSVNIYDALISRSRQYLAQGKPEKAGTVLETTLLEILVKICENRKVKSDQSEKMNELVDKLENLSIIPQQVAERLKRIDSLLNETTTETHSFEEAMAWIQSFLNDYLGSQIMILN